MLKIAGKLSAPLEKCDGVNFPTLIYVGGEHLSLNFLLYKYYSIAKIKGLLISSFRRFCLNVVENLVPLVH